MNIDILVVTNRLVHLKRCMEKILPFNNPVLVVVDGYNEDIINFLSELSERYRHLEFIILKDRIEKSKARNVGIRASKADVIYFLDDDAYFEADNPAVLREKYSRYPEISIIGGPNLTPGGSTFFQRVSGYVFSAAFTAWGMRKRYLRGSADVVCDDKQVILCNLAVKREVFIREGIFFDERLCYNEENLFLEQLKAKGYAMLCCPSLEVYHARRETMWQFARQIYGSGRGRAVMARIMPRTLSWYHTVPSLFLLYLVFLFFFCGLLFWLPFFMYLLINALNALSLCVKNKENAQAFILVFILSFVAHVSYGYGFLSGLLWNKKS